MKNKITNLENQIHTLQNLRKLNGDFIKQLKSNNSNIEQELHQVEDEFQFVSTRLFGTTETYTQEEINSLSTKIMGDDIYYGPGTVITFDLDEEKHLEFLKAIDKKLPDLESLDIDYIPLNSKDVKTFLKFYFPNKVETFFFNHGPELSGFDFYRDELSLIAQHVSFGMYVCNFDDNNSTTNLLESSTQNLMALLSASKHVNEFGFIRSKLRVPSVPDFGTTLDGSQIQKLKLSKLDKEFFVSKDNNPSDFENLMEGLSKSKDFKDNLKELFIWGSGVNVEETKDILKKQGYRDIGMFY